MGDEMSMYVDKSLTEQAVTAIRQILRAEGSLPPDTLRWKAMPRQGRSAMPKDVFTEALKMLEDFEQVEITEDRVTWIGDNDE